MFSVSSVHVEPVFSRCEFDSHADTCGVNDVAKILSYTGKVVQVSAYSPTIEKLEDIPIVSAALAYDDSLTGETFIIIINQALYLGDTLKTSYDCT